MEKSLTGVEPIESAQQKGNSALTSMEKKLAKKGNELAVWT